MDTQDTTQRPLPAIHTRENGKLVSAREAVRLIRDGDTVATGGFVGIGFAEEIAMAVEALCLACDNDAPASLSKPGNLTLVYAAGQGDGGDRGLNHFALPGLVKPYVEMISEVVARYYIGVTRFTTSAFMRTKLGDTLARRGLAPYVYETEAEAKASLREQPGSD